ncbi:hypothetical protein ACR2YU_26445, partial [Klebsiella pneumoniae]
GLRLGRIHVEMVGMMEDIPNQSIHKMNKVLYKCSPRGAAWNGRFHFWELPNQYIHQRNESSSFKIDKLVIHLKGSGVNSKVPTLIRHYRI